MHEDIVGGGATRHRLIEHNVLLGDHVLCLGPRETPVHAGLPDTQVLSILNHAGNDALRTTIMKNY